MRGLTWGGIIALVLLLPAISFAGSGAIGLGIRVGVNQIDGDISGSKISPFTFGQLKYQPLPYLDVGAEFGYGILTKKDDAISQAPDFNSTLFMPFEGDLTFNLLPLSAVNPYVVIGAGGVYWNAIDENGSTIVYEGSTQNGVDSFVKTGGGVSIRLNSQARFNVGWSYRYSLTDALDQTWSGDENDAIAGAYMGFTYFFPFRRPVDTDRDGIPDSFDASPGEAEDWDGYMDHDGIPDSDETLSLLSSFEPGLEAESAMAEDRTPPVVIHHPVFKAEERRSLPLDADIYENRNLRTAAILYRPEGERKWKVSKMRNTGGTRYRGVIPGQFVRRGGLQYFMVAVDESHGLGHSGLISRPIRVEVFENPRRWRLLGGTAAVLGWGAATYLGLRKQN